jgi:predicted nucleic acid-binding Zn ribbon protein
MGGQPFSETPCVLCSKPVDLRVDLCSDENGKAIHEDCYVQRVTGQHGNPPLAMAN